MTVRIIVILGGLAAIVLLSGALNVSRGCGSFPVDIKVTGAPLASLRYETFSDRTRAEGYARLARESDEDMHAGRRLSGETAQIEVPFSDVTSFFGLHTKHEQPRYAVIALTAADGAKRVRVVLLPRHGSADHTIAIADQ